MKKEFDLEKYHSGATVVCRSWMFEPVHIEDMDGYLRVSIKCGSRTTLHPYKYHGKVWSDCKSGMDLMMLE